MAMLRYRVLAPMMLHPGALLGLTPLQAQARRFGLEPVGELWRVVKPVGFKAGEELEHDGDLPKALAQAATPLGDAAPATPAPVARPASRKPSARRAATE